MEDRITAGAPFWARPQDATLPPLWSFTSERFNLEPNAMHKHNHPDSATPEGTNLRERLKQGLAAVHMRSAEESEQSANDGMIASDKFWNSHQCRKISYDLLNGIFIPGDTFRIDTVLQKLVLKGFYDLFHEYERSNTGLTKPQITKKDKLQACWRFLFLNTCHALREHKAAISISMDKNNYTESGKYYCKLWSYSELQTVTSRAVSEGYLKKYTGRQYRDRESYITRLEILDKFHDLIEGYVTENQQSNGGELPNDFTGYDLLRRIPLPKPDKPLLSIKTIKDKNIKNKTYIRTEPSRSNRNVQLMYNHVKAYNEYMNKQEILLRVALENTKESHLKIIFNAMYSGELEVINPTQILTTRKRSGTVQHLKDMIYGYTEYNNIIACTSVHNNITTHIHNQTRSNDPHQLYPFSSSGLVNDSRVIEVPSDKHLYFHQKRYHCYRVFSNTIKNGGRFYGVVYQQLPGEIRQKTFINGSPVAELDYKSLHPSLLYSRIGVQPPKNIYVFEDKGDIERNLMKATALVIFNADNEQKALKAIRKEYCDGYGRMLGNEILNLFIEGFFHYNPDLRQFYLQGVGSALQYQDSQIMDRILTSLIKQDIPAIPIHDSIVVPVKNVRAARETMEEAYQYVTGTDHVPYITDSNQTG